MPADRKDLQTVGSYARRIYETLQAKKSSTSSYRRTTSQPSPRAVPKLVLQLPTDTFHEIAETGCPKRQAQELNSVFNETASTIKEHWESVYQTTYSASITPRHGAGKHTNSSSVIQRLYDQQISALRSEILEKAREIIDRMEEKPTHSNPSFNRAFKPYLEKYFEDNAYPNIQHRILLAKQSEMTLRQIGTWFQNHRNRARKEGRELKNNPNIRLNLSFGDDHSTDSDDESQHALSEVESSSTDDEDEIIPSPPTSSISNPAVFSQSVPPHAFPVPYTEINHRHCSISSGERARVLLTPWHRQPAEPRPAKSLKKIHEGEIEDLSIWFMTLQARYLNKHGKPSKKKKRKRIWNVHLRTIAETAPLPSFVPNSSSEPAHPIKLSQSKPASIFQVKNAFRNYQEPLVTLIPPTTTRHHSPTKRQRPSSSTDRAQTPTGSCLSSRASTPSTASSIGSPLFSPAPPSRRRRLELDSSSSSDEPSRKRRRTSVSSSGSSSSLSSAITTPLLGYRQLANAGKPSIASTESEFDFTSLDDKLSRPQPLTWAEAFHFGFQPPTMTAKDMSFTLDFTDSSWQTQPSVYIPP